MLIMPTWYVSFGTLNLTVFVSSLTRTQKKIPFKTAFKEITKGLVFEECWSFNEILCTL